MIKKELLFFMYWNVTDLNGDSISQKLLVNGFRWIIYISRFNKHNIKSYNGNSNKGFILEVGVQYPRFLQRSYNELPFLPERIKIKSLYSIYKIKKNMSLI